MRANTTKAKLAEGKVVFGAIISRHAPDMVELLGAIGYDFVMIDCEHGPMSLDEVEHMVRAAGVLRHHPDHADPEPRGLDDPPLRRPGRAGDHRAARQHARGGGVGGESGALHPEGHRGMAGGRPHDYGVGVTRDESTRWLNSQLLVIPMIEETEAVANLDAILTVPGVDVLHVASGDLGQSMGNPGPAAVRQLMRQVIPRIRAGGKLVGVGGNAPSDAAGVAEFIKLGANLVTISSLGLLRLGAEDFRQRVQAAL